MPQRTRQSLQVVRTALAACIMMASSVRAFQSSGAGRVLMHVKKGRKRDV
jgi:hypothetical protein